jgi:hypothetical protein
VEKALRYAVTPGYGDHHGPCFGKDDVVFPDPQGLPEREAPPIAHSTLAGAAKRLVGHTQRPSMSHRLGSARTPAGIFEVLVNEMWIRCG